MEKGWIWAEPDGSVFGVAADGTIVQLGSTLWRLNPKRRIWIEVDGATLAYLKSHPNPEDW